MTAVDTSLVAALFASWHEAHEIARESVPADARVPAHVLLETCSVLTRLPPPHRAPADVVEAFLARRFRAAPLTLPAERHRSLLKTLADREITGGGVYDALIGATALHAGATLLTRDRRAARTYESVGASYRLLV